MKRNLQLKVLSHSCSNLWAEIGKYCADKEVSKELGINITSNDNCSWYLAFYDNRMVGFCCAESKINHVVFKHDYVIKPFRKEGIYTELFKYRMSLNKGSVIKSTCNENSIGTYLTNGFRIIGNNGKYKKLIKDETTN